MGLLLSPVFFVIHNEKNVDFHAIYHFYAFLHKIGIGNMCQTIDQIDALGNG